MHNLKYNAIPDMPTVEEGVVNAVPLDPRPAIASISSVFGLDIIFELSRDGKVLLICKMVRMFSFGILGVMLALYLTTLGYSDRQIGLLFTLTLFGDAGISLILTTHADRYGRRKCLVLGSALALITSIIFITQKNFIIMIITATLGVISPSGTEVGPFMAIELSALSQVTSTSHRTKLMAWYNLGGCVSCAFGSLACGFLLQHLQREHHIENGLLEFKIVLTVYAAVQAILLICFSSLSADVEVPLDDNKMKSINPVNQFLGLHNSKQIIFKLSVLFMIDSFAGSFVIQSLITDWFYLEFNTRPEDLGSILFVCNLVAGVSALFAAQLAESIGLIMTMVVTHVPSNLLLILVPLMPTQSLAIVVLCSRFCISQMDVPTRNAYVQGVVNADERSAANGITNIVRSIGAATGPMLSGILLANPQTRNYPFYIAGILKIVYDVLLLLNFKGVKSTSDRK